jgi:hypothetical protein
MIEGQDLRKHCVCQKYYNPDEMLLACPSPNCKAWLHTDCILDAVLTKRYNEIRKSQGRKTGGRVSGASKSHEVNLNKLRQRYSKRLNGKIVDEGSKIEITDLKTKEVTKEDIKCLKCGAQID